MEAKDQRETQSPGSESHGVHVCNKCGWQYPKPHPSAKHRRAHKKNCGTIKGYELVAPGNETAPGLDDEHHSDNEYNTPSPTLVDKAEVKIGGIGAISYKSEQEVFEDAACEFSGSPTRLRSDSSMENKEQTIVDIEKIAKNPGEIQQSSSSSTSCEMRNSGFSDSCEVSSAEVLETREPVPISTETVAYKQQDDKSSAQGTSHSVISEIMIGSSQVAHTGANDTVKDVGSETDDKGNGHAFSEGNSRDGMPSELASTVGKRVDASDHLWNDDVIYSEVEGPDEFALEKSVTIESAEDESSDSEKIPVDTSAVTANTAQEIAPTDSAESSLHGHGITTDKDDNVSFSVPNYKPFVENAEDSLCGFKGHKEVKLNQFTSPSLHETTKEGYESDTDNLAEHPGIQSGQLSIDKERLCSDMLLLDHKDVQGQDNLVAVEEFPIKENTVVSKIEKEDGNHPEEPIVSRDIEIKTGKNEGNESSSGTAHITGVSETLRMSVSGADTVVGEYTADVIHIADPISPVGSVGHENELVEENNEAISHNIKPTNERNSMESNLESSGVTEPHVFPVPDVVDGDDGSDHWTGSRETLKNSLPQDDAEVCRRNSEGPTESSRRAAEENIPVEITNAQEDAVSCFGSTVTASDAVKTSDQKLSESERTDFHRVLGGLGVIQGNEVGSNGNTQEYLAEVPVAIESNDVRDFGRLQNLSQAHIKSLVPSLLATANTSNASEVADAIKSQPPKSEENASSVESESNNAAGDVAVHSSNICDSLEATWGSVSDTPISVNMELKKSCTKASTDTPTRDDAEKSYEFVDMSTGVDGEIKKPESQPSSSDAAAADLSKNQEIMEKIPTCCSEKQQHVPLKNLLSEARSPQLEAADNKNNNSPGAIPRVSSILGPETSPDSSFPEKGEVSEEWKTPARYPVNVKREERKGKNRPFWVPFVCCSSR